MAGKLGKICTAVSLASFRQKNLTKYYVKFPAKRYSYIISKKNLVVIFLSWYLHQFCKLFLSILDWDLSHESIFRSLKRKSIMARQRYWLMVQSEFIVEIMNCFWCFDEIQSLFFLDIRPAMHMMLCHFLRSSKQSVFKCNTGEMIKTWMILIFVVGGCDRK